MNPRPSVLETDALPLSYTPTWLSYLFYGKNYGARRRDRTSDAHLFRMPLYRLSYPGPYDVSQKIELVAVTGFEPVALEL